MNKFLLVFLAVFLTMGAPIVHAGDGTPVPEEEKEPDCD